MTSFFRRKRRQLLLAPSDAADATIARLDQMADRLEASAVALEALVERMREEETQR